VPSGNPVDELFAANLRAARERAGLSQEGLAAKMAASGHPMRQQVIARIEAGLRPVRLGEAMALAEAVGTTAGTLAMPPAIVAEAAALAEEASQARAAHAAAIEQAARFAVLRESLAARVARAESVGQAGVFAPALIAAREALALPPPLEENPDGVH
jgi:transcriptional regulator with XRE-family HTH domain